MLANREEARQAIKDSGIAFDKQSLRKFMSILKRTLANSKAIRGTLAIDKSRLRSTRCRSDYFWDREAVTFYNDGFVGIAGWADDENVRPFLDAIEEWIKTQAVRSL